MRLEFLPEEEETPELPFLAIHTGCMSTRQGDGCLQAKIRGLRP